MSEYRANYYSADIRVCTVEAKDIDEAIAEFIKYFNGIKYRKLGRDEQSNEFPFYQSTWSAEVYLDKKYLARLVGSGKKVEIQKL